MEEKLDELVERLKGKLGDRLLSVILYGSAAAGDYHGGYSDLNVLCVVSKLGLTELGLCEPALAWWRQSGNPAPLLMTLEEVKHSSDCFPIEFEDMIERRRVLFGVDAIAGIAVRRVYYRAQLEHELRSRLFRLRRMAAAVLNDRKALLKLMLDSVSTFLVLLRHAMMLSGVRVANRKRDVAAKLSELGAEPRPFETLLDVREGNLAPDSVDAAALFAAYLDQIEGLVRVVDGLEEA